MTMVDLKVMVEDRGAWRVLIYRMAKDQARLNGR